MTERPKGSYSDKEINEIANWFVALSFEQLVFLKHSYEQMMDVQAKACGHNYVH